MDENSYLCKKGEEMSQTNFISSNGGDFSKAKRNTTFHFSQSMDIFDADIDELLPDSS